MDSESRTEIDRIKQRVAELERMLTTSMGLVKIYGDLFVTGRLLGGSHPADSQFYTSERLNRSVHAGDGLAGGGKLTGDVTLAVGGGSGITINPDGVEVDQGYAFTWTAPHAFQNNITARNVLPEATDTYDLGSSLKLWRKGWLSELDTVLFAKNTISVVGGWMMIAKGEGVLPVSVLAAETQIDFGQAMTNGQFVVFRGLGQVEYVQVGALVAGTTYNVTRNLDGTGANDWPAGAVYVVLGVSGDGRIELNSNSSPIISVIQQGAAYNVQTERVRIGDLNGWGDYVTSLYGVAIGEYAAAKANLTLDPTNGLRLRIHNVDYIQLDTAGAAKILGKLQMPGTGSALAIGATPPTAANVGTGLWLDRTGLYSLAAGAYQVKIDAATGKLYGGGGVVILDADGISVAPGTVAGSTDAKNSYHFIDGSTVISRLLANHNAMSNELYLTALQVVGKDTQISIDGTAPAGHVGTVTIAGRSKLVSGLTQEARIFLDGNPEGSSPEILMFGNVEVLNDLNVSGALQKSSVNGYIYVPLAAPLTSTSWDGDAKTIANRAIIDLSTVFGAPAGIKAINARLELTDDIVGSYVALGPSATYAANLVTVAQVASKVNTITGIANCDANGDVYFYCDSAIASVKIEIWGYFI